MLTDRDEELAAQGLVSFDRLSALRHALLSDSLAARDAARRRPKNDPHAIALRGKKVAYLHAADMVMALLNGKALRRPIWARSKPKEDQI
jgi:hypothetical protein